jgi:hypothetical protein
MTQPFLKPGVLWPLPVGLRQILDIIETAIRSTLQEDEPPAAQFVDIKVNSCRGFFQVFVNADWELWPPESHRRQILLKIIDRHRYLLCPALREMTFQHTLMLVDCCLILDDSKSPRGCSFPS